MSDALQYLTPMVGNKPKFLFLLSILCGPAQLDQPYSPTMMLQDNDDFLEVLKEALWDKLELQSSGDEDQVVTRILDYLQTGAGPEDEYVVTVEGTFDITSHEAAVEQFIAMIQEAVNDPDRDTLVFNSINNRTGDEMRITKTVFNGAA